MALRGNNNGGNGAPNGWIRRAIEELQHNLVELRRASARHEARMDRTGRTIQVLTTDLIAQRKESKVTMMTLVEALKNLTLLNHRVERLEARRT